MCKQHLYLVKSLFYKSYFWDPSSPRDSMGDEPDVYTEWLPLAALISLAILDQREEDKGLFAAAVLLALSFLHAGTGLGCLEPITELSFSSFQINTHVILVILPK